MVNLEQYDIVIFDLGGVLLNLSFERAKDKFCQLYTGSDFEELYQDFLSLKTYEKYERGEISTDAFRQSLRDYFSFEDLPDEAIDQAWNTILLDVPDNRLKLLKKLRQSKTLAMLSNTNEIHQNYFRELFIDRDNKSNIGPQYYFDHLFYSYKLGLRKPDLDIYRVVLQKLQLERPERALFLDDLEDNILAAREVGLSAIQVTPTQDIITLLDSN